MSEMNGQQVYENFKQGRGTESLRSAAEELMKLQGTYKERAGSMKSIQGQMSEAWEGDASAKARSGINPAMAALEDSAGYMDQTTNSMVDQTTEWHHADASVVPVPDKPDKPSGWSVAAKSMIPVVGPSMAKDDVDNYRDGAAEHNEAAKQNVHVMNGYDNNTTANSNFPTEYGKLHSFGSDITGVEDGNSGGSDTEGSDTGSVGWVPGPNDGDPYGGSTGRGPMGVSEPPSDGAGSFSSGGGTHNPGGSSGDVDSLPAAQTDTSTSSSGFTPHGPGSGGGADGGGGHGTGDFGSRGTGRPGGTGYGQGSHAGGGMFGPSNPGGSGDGAGRGSARPGGGAGTPGGVRVGTGSGSGAPGSGSGGVRGGAGSGGAGSGGVRGGLGAGGGSAGGAGSGASSGAEPGRGSTSGVARGGSAAGEGGYGSSASGSGSGAGGRGAGGMRGGMPMGGAGAGRGGGEEEHQKKTEVLENHPESLFVGDLPKTTPPVIGE